MEILPVILEGQYVRLEPLTLAHEEPLNHAAADGELWHSKVTIVPTRETMKSYIQEALDLLAQKRHLAFAILRRSDGRVVGTTRFYGLEHEYRTVEIGYTWIARSTQRSPVNTEAKLLMLTHAFEHWKCIRAQLVTDVLNEQSRAAISRLGAKEEGVLRNHMIMPDGRIRDSVCFSIIDSEWPEVKARLEGKLRNRELNTDLRAKIQNRER